MLTKLTIRNFKRFQNVEIELGNPVVFVGPNNSGKTTALQALALWGMGLPKEIVDVVNIRDIVSTPVPNAELLWRDLDRTASLEVEVEGTLGSNPWRVAVHYMFINGQSLARTLLEGWGFPPVKLAFLTPMGGLVSAEPRLDRGAIDVRIGEGRTGEVLRNLCYLVHTESPERWVRTGEQMQRMFGIELGIPQYVAARGEISLSYREGNNEFDVSASGRGLQHTLLLLTFMAANPGAVLLLDEPDAHLEILRQREIYEVLTETARTTESQIMMATYSEVILDEAGDRDAVVAFLGKPHRIDDRGSQLRKSLRDIRFDQYLQAEQTGWVLYLEGSTDLEILRAFAVALGHAAAVDLRRPFVHYVGNQPPHARDHFFGLLEAHKSLVGFALFDNRERPLQSHPNLTERMWIRCEIESYLCTREALLAWAAQQSPGGARAMEEAVADLEQALGTLGKPSPWSPDLKVSDEFLTPLFTNFYDRLGLQNLMAKSNFHALAPFVPKDQIDPEVVAVLDQIHATALRAKPAADTPSQ